VRSTSYWVSGAIRSTLLEAWQIYRTRFLLIAAVVIVVWLPCELINSYAGAFIFPPDDFVKSYKLGQFFANFVGIIATAAVTFIAMTSRMGQTASFGSAMEAGLRAWGRLWWARLLSGLVILIGLVLLVVPGIYLMTRLAFVETVAVVEGTTGSTAMKRSFDLTEGRFWKTFLFGVAAFGLFIIPMAIVNLGLGFAQGLIPALDYWLVDAAGALVCDVLSAFIAVAFFCGYEVYDRQREALAPADASAAVA